MEILYGPGSGMSNAGRITGCHGKLTSYFFHKIISTLLLTVLIMCAILQIEQKRRAKQKKDFKRPAWFLPPPVPETYL
jgi:hypothetical protein